MAAPDHNQAQHGAVTREDAVQLTTIGLAAGTFSALFGVGGGTVLVPLLAIWRGLGERKGAGTSLLAIAIIAAYGALSYAIVGHIDVAKGVLIGIPAIGGVIVGTAIQQRLSDRVLSGMFAILMVVVIVMYVVN